MVQMDQIYRADWHSRGGLNDTQHKFSNKSDKHSFILAMYNRGTRTFIIVNQLQLVLVIIFDPDMESPMMNHKTASSLLHMVTIVSWSSLAKVCQARRKQ
jgi:hypothetical protein